MILHLYFARRALMAILTVAGIFVLLATMIETLEQLRIFARADLGMSTILFIAAMKIPKSLYDVLPIVVVIATLVLYLGLARSSELVVTRAAGRSAMTALISPLLLTFMIGVVAVAVLNPIVSSTTRQYDQLTSKYLENDTRIFSVSEEGIWLRQGSEAGQVVIRASQSNVDGSQLYGVTFVGFTVTGQPSFRIEAAAATLEPRKWHLTQVKKWTFIDTPNPEASAEMFDIYDLDTTLTLDEIHDTFATPSAVPIWELPNFIRRLEKAGFSARIYQMWFQSELALPLTLVAMMLIGAGFTMRHARLGKTANLVLTAIILSFAFFFLRNFASILGGNGEVPIMLAAWAPPVAVILAALALLLHLEDG